LQNGRVHFKIVDPKYTVPMYEIIVQEDLDFTCIYLGWALPKDSRIKKEFPNLQYSTISFNKWVHYLWIMFRTTKS